MRNVEELEKDDQVLKNVLNKEKSETEQNDTIIQEIPTINTPIQVDSQTVSTNKDNQKGQLNLTKTNIVLSLIFSFMLLLVSSLQYITYNRQANIAEDSNKLVKYEYRFEFYKKLEDLQREVSIIKLDPKIDIEQYADLNYKILSLYRESGLLFDESISEEINIILGNHLELLTIQNTTVMLYDDYKNEMQKLISEYGLFINSDNFKKYLDINAIE